MCIRDSYYALALALRAEQREILQISFLCGLLPRFALTYRAYYKAALTNHLYRLFHVWEQAAGPVSYTHLDVYKRQ